MAINIIKSRASIKEGPGSKKFTFTCIFYSKTTCRNTVKLNQIYSPHTRAKAFIRSIARSEEMSSTGGI